MKATLEPLVGKYYGTIITIDFGDGTEEINLWDMGDYEPSKRALAERGYTEEEWETNAIVDDGWGGKMEVREDDFRSSGHYESKTTYERALLIIEKLNA